MIEAQPAEQVRVVGREIHIMRCHAQSDTRQPPVERRAKIESNLGITRDSFGGTMFHGESHSLLECLTGERLEGISERERSAVGLKGAICPVALILHLEQVSLEGEPHVDTTLQ